MKKILLILSGLWLAVLSAGGQDRELVINYIAHDHYTNEMLDVVEEIFQTHSHNSNKSVYLYLANGGSPVILKCEERNRRQFQDFCTVINADTKHISRPEVDIQRILDLLSQDDFKDNSGRMRYDYVTFNFYITYSFWNAGFVESLIGHLMWDLDFDSIPNALLQIYRPREDEKFDESMLFGPKRLNGNYKVFIFDY